MTIVNAIGWLGVGFVAVFFVLAVYAIYIIQAWVNRDYDED